MSGIGHQKNVSASSKARRRKLCVRSLFIVVTGALCYYCSYHVWIQPALAIPKHLDTTTMEIKQPSTKYSTSTALNPNNYKPNKDPYLNTTNCLTLLESYRMGGISQMKQGREEYPIDKSYIRRTITSKPFYVSVHDDQIDSVRTDLFLTGRYYESKLSKIIQNVFDQKTQEGHSKTTSDHHHDDPTIKTSPTKKSIMIDVGGNIGWFSLLAAAHGAEVFTFEPNVINMVRFCESQILNGWVAPPPPPPIADDHVHDFEQQQQDQYNRIHSYLKGVSYTHGAMQPMFQINANNPGSYTFSNQSVVQEKVEDGMLLPLVTLDALAMDQGWIMTEKKNEDHATITNNQPYIGFLKIDVEGLELSVLKGATQLLKSGLVENIAMEFKINMGRKTLVEIVKILFDSGYVANEIGGWQGPSETLLSGKLIRQYKSPELFIDDLLAKFVNADANVWFQLADKNEINNNRHSNP